MDFLNLPAGMEKIILYDDHYYWLYGWSVHLAAARYIDSTTIEVRSADNFASVVDRDVCFSILPWEGHFITDATLVYYAGVWCFAAGLAVDDPTLDLVAEVAVFDIENQEAVWRIKALLEYHRNGAGNPRLPPQMTIT